MPDAAGAALLRLMAWLSPAFPVGGFSYSHGLERAVHDGLVADADSLADWLATLVESGSGWNDAVLLAESWRRARDGGDLAEVAELAEALAGSQERHMESMLQGAAFLKAARAWGGTVFDRLPEDCAYCVAVGAVTGAPGSQEQPLRSSGDDRAPPPLTPPHKGEGGLPHAKSPSPLWGGVRGGGTPTLAAPQIRPNINLQPVLAAFLQAFASNLIQAAIRLSVIGQRSATTLLAHFEPVILATAQRAARSSLDDLGACAFASDIVAMRHEVQYSRLFRS